MKDHGGSIVNIIADVRNGFPNFSYVLITELTASLKLQCTYCRVHQYCIIHWPTIYKFKKLLSIMNFFLLTKSGRAISLL